MIHPRLLFLFAVIALLAASPSEAQKIGVVRLPRVIEAHPRMGKFNPETHRFLDGPSAPTDLAEAGKRIEVLQLRLGELTRQEQALKADLEKSLANPQRSRSAAEETFWKKKGKLAKEKEAVSLELGSTVSRIQFNGLTPVTTLFQEIDPIVRDVMQSIRQSAESSGCELILTEPEPIGGFDLEKPFPNDYSRAWQEIKPEKQKPILELWLKKRWEMAARLHNQIRTLKPCLTGAVDLTDNAIRRLIRSQTKPKGGSFR